MSYFSIKSVLQKFRLSFITLLLITMTMISTMSIAQTGDASDADLSGQLLFQKNCAVCHGNEGAGGVGVPLNMKDFLTTTSNKYLQKTIRMGRPGRIMPAFGNLSDKQIASIIQHIRSWGPGIKAPVYSQDAIKGDVKKGLAIYDAVCFNCHRERGIGGKGTGVTFSRPREAEILAPAIGNPAFLTSASDHMIKTIIMTGRESTPMTSAQSMGINENDVDNVVSYLRSLAISDSESEAKAVVDKTDEAVLSFESSYPIEETIENIKQAALGYNFRYIREQTLNHGFVDKDQESNKEYLIYFCNFTFLNKALAVDPRIGMFLPFRATIVEKEGVVSVMTVNPDYLCSLFNNDELKQSCNFMAEKYEAMLEESTL